MTRHYTFLRKEGYKNNKKDSYFVHISTCRSFWSDKRKQNNNKNIKKLGQKNDWLNDKENAVFQDMEHNTV